MPNVVFIPTDALTLAHERMKAATVNQLRTALVMNARGEDVGVYRQYLTPFLVLVREAV